MDPDHALLILVVDDEPPVIDILQRLGQQIFPEAQFVSTSSPQETVDYLADQASSVPQLILLDIDLHQSMNGIELLPQLRSLLKQPTPIIMFTALVRQPAIQQAYEAGAVAYTSKPENLEGWKSYVTILKKYWYETSRLPRLPSDQ